MTEPSPSKKTLQTVREEAAQRGLFVWSRNKFLAGVALTLPIAITVVILKWVYDLLHAVSEPVLLFFVDLTNEMAGLTLVSVDDPNFILATRFIGVLLPILALVALGVMATNVIGVRIVAAMDRLLLTIPFVSFIYRSLRQVIDSFKSLGDAQNFKRVAYIDYPVPGLRMLGFVTGQFTDPNTAKAMTTVFMPTAPNPTTGILLVVDSDKVTDAKMTLEEAMKLIFSGGLVPPEGSVLPMNQAAVPEQSETEEPDESTLPVADVEDPEGAEEEDFVPMLPRAEDFDSGDPDIMSTADELSEASRRSRLAKVLPWKRNRPE